MKCLAVIVKKASVYQKLISTVNLLEKLIKNVKYTPIVYLRIFEFLN